MLFKIDEIIKDDLELKVSTYGLEEVLEADWVVVYFLLDFLKQFQDSSQMLESRKTTTINMSILNHTSNQEVFWRKIYHINLFALLNMV